ncbi:MAG: SRPBCC domain-containing protein [Bacteroidota bacterium]
MKESFELTEFFPVSAAVLYQAWLDSEAHSKMTGGEARCSAKEGETFTAWNQYISGRNISLIADEKIVQSWRTTQFQEDDEDSELTILLTEATGGCQMRLIHTNIPEGQTQYKQGWLDHYFGPMKGYFGSK